MPFLSMRDTVVKQALHEPSRQAAKARAKNGAKTSGGDPFE
jgi:hypothetical protein